MKKLKFKLQKNYTLMQPHFTYEIFFKYFFFNIIFYRHESQNAQRGMSIPATSSATNCLTDLPSLASSIIIEVSSFITHFSN